MNWKFWKKDELGLSDLGGFKSDLGSFGGASNTGLDLSDHFQPPGTPPAAPTFNQAYPMPPMQSNFTSPPPFSAAPPQPIQQMSSIDEHREHNISKDLEVIAAKLDTIRAQLEMLNSRVANLEKQEPPPRKPWY